MFPQSIRFQVCPRKPSVVFWSTTFQKLQLVDGLLSSVSVLCIRMWQNIYLFSKMVQWDFTVSIVLLLLLHTTSHVMVESPVHSGSPSAGRTDERKVMGWTFREWVVVGLLWLGIPEASVVGHMVPIYCPARRICGQIYDVMSLAVHYWMGDAHHCSWPPISEMTYTASSGTLNPGIPHHTVSQCCRQW